MLLNSIYLAVICGAVLVVRPVSAAVTIADFETDLAGWQTSQTLPRVERSEKFSADGTRSLHFTVPAWRPGAPEWPSMECRFDPPADWGEATSLKLTLRNPTAAEELVGVMITDPDKPKEFGYTQVLHLAAETTLHLEIPMADIWRKIDGGRVALIHLFTERPSRDYELFVDRIELETFAPESWPALRADAVRRLQQVEEALAQDDSAFGKIFAADWQGDWQKAESLLAQERATLPERRQLEQMLIGLEGKSAYRAAIEKWIDRTPESAPLLTAWASPTEKIFPYDRLPTRWDFDSCPLTLAGNEYESVQLLLFSPWEAQPDLAVTVSDLTGESGNIPATAVEIAPVGFVRTTQSSPLNTEYLGWWPDIVMNRLKRFNLAARTLQAVWLTVKTPSGQSPGFYRGTVTVSAGERLLAEVPWGVEVYDFDLPSHAPLPLAITTSWPDRSGGTPVERMAFMEFLDKYHINFDNLYRSGEPDWAVIEAMKARGSLVAFNLMNALNDGVSPDQIDATIERLIARITPAYQEAKARGLLKQAYIYGFDERSEEQFPALEKMAAALKSHFPEVPVMTSAYDFSCGTASGVGSVDIWVPLSTRFQPEMARKAREAGRKVWWYLCCVPELPAANVMLENPLGAIRNFFGFTTAACAPDGFLYYDTTFWRDNAPVGDELFTAWNPVSFSNYHQDGALLYRGENGVPLASLRLENLRDGLDDYAYYRIFAHHLAANRKHTATSALATAWVEKYEVLEKIPADIFAGMNTFATDFASLTAYRASLAAAIAASPEKSLPVWAAEPGVRGVESAPNATSAVTP